MFNNAHEVVLMTDCLFFCPVSEHVTCGRCRTSFRTRLPCPRLYARICGQSKKRHGVFRSFLSLMECCCWYSWCRLSVPRAILFLRQTPDKCAFVCLENTRHHEDLLYDCKSWTFKQWPHGSTVVLRTSWPCPCVYMSHQLLLAGRSHCRECKKEEELTAFSSPP